MEITLDKRDLLKVLNNGGMFAGRYKALPILDSVKVRIKSDSINVVSTDNENAVSSKIAISDTGLAEEVTFCVNCKDVINYVKLVTGDSVRLVIENDTLTIKHKRGKTKMPIFPYDDFPTMIMDAEYSEFSMESAYLNNWIMDAQNFTANDSLRPMMNGIYFYGSGGEVGCCASDGHILFHDKFNRDKTYDFDFVLNKSAFRPVCNVCSCGENVSVRVGSRNVMFSSDGISVIARRIDGKYPNFKSIIPQDANTSVTLDKKEFVDSINRCMCSANKNCPLAKISLGDDKMEIMCQDIDFSTSATETLDVKAKDVFVIGANANNILSALNVFEDGELRLEFISNSKPIVVRSDLEFNKLVIVMPMMLN